MGIQNQHTPHTTAQPGGPQQGQNATGRSNDDEDQLGTDPGSEEEE